MNLLNLFNQPLIADKIPPLKTKLTFGQYLLLTILSYIYRITVVSIICTAMVFVGKKAAIAESVVSIARHIFLHAWNDS